MAESKTNKQREGVSTLCSLHSFIKIFINQTGSPTFHFHANEDIQLDSFIKDLLQKIQFLLETVIRREKSRQSTTVIDVIRE
ncbi:hypothetical protein CDAR_47431 [Caerostris darwini]|uniref:Uncharacterized protein n=1 Tax=Caerostris darwini TaxID=1538125 RepID=A0AAV4M867_9ARAC|nr:hypothetical protein CDAR_47431 [Caerostris darwini]